MNIEAARKAAALEMQKYRTLFEQFKESLEEYRILVQLRKLIGSRDKIFSKSYIEWVQANRVNELKLDCSDFLDISNNLPFANFCGTSGSALTKE
jgi:hypothetical protein